MLLPPREIANTSGSPGEPVTAGEIVTWPPSANARLVSNPIVTEFVEGLSSTVKPVIGRRAPSSVPFTLFFAKAATSKLAGFAAAEMLSA